MEEPPVDEKQASQKEQSKKAKLLIIGVVVLGSLYAYNAINSRGTKTQLPDKREQVSPPVEAISSDSAAANSADAGKEPAKGIDIEKGDTRAYVLEFDKRLTQMSQTQSKMIDDIKENQSNLERKLQDMNNAIDKKIGILVEEQTKSIDDNARNLRYGPGGLPAPGDQLTGPIGGATGDKKQAKSQIEYVSFGQGGTQTGKPFQPVQDAKDALAEKFKTPETKLASNQAIQESSGVKAVSKKKIGVPAAAYAHVTMLHAVNCPIGDNLAVPVVLPIMGAIRGPNGNIVDLGNAHLQGKCVGLANSERGRITIEKISYVGADGKQQFVKVEGYVVDRRDSDQDVKGYYDSKAGSAIAKAALTNAIAALGKLAVLAESTTSVSSATGAVTSNVTGNIGKAAIGASISGAADRTAMYFQGQLERIIPFVHIEAALPLDFVSTAPFEVEDNDEVLADANP